MTGAGAPGPLTRRYVAWALRHGRVLWAIALVLAVPALVRTVTLYAHLKSDLEELLPRDAPSVVAIDELRRRMPGLQYLGVLVDAGSAENMPAAERFVDELAARVRQYPPALVRRVRTGIAEERAFVEKHAVVYADLADLVTIRDRIEARRDWEATRAMGADLALDDEPPSVEMDDLEKKHEGDRSLLGRIERDRFSSTPKHTTLLLVEVGGFETGSSSAGRLLGRVKDDVAALGGLGRYASGMRLGFTGDVAISVEELSALVEDLTISTVIVILAVLAVIVAFYRWLPAIAILALPLSLATLYTFALVTLPPASIDALNSNTAFLGSVIVGNGVNFGIVLLARYVEERRRGAALEEALAWGVWGTRTGTGVASAAAAVAYGSLMLTRFRGFRQFGVIGGVGMLTCWGVSFLLMPSLVAFFEARGRAPGRGAAPGSEPMRRLASFVSARARLVAAAFAALSLVSVFALRKLDRSRIEYDFSQLRRADTHVSGEGYWGKKMDDLLGRYLSPTVALADDAEQARRAAAALERATKAPPLDAMIQNVQTVDDVLPREQDAKIAEARKIRRVLTPKIRSLIPEARRKDVDRVLADEGLRPISVDDLPATFTAGLREHDGTVGRAVLVYPRPSDATWKGDAMIDATRALRGAVADVSGARGAAPRIAGSIALSSDIIESIARDGPIATMVALAGVILVVATVFRRRAATPLIVASLLLGVLWLAAATIAFGIKINFCNFIAFPITFGIGVDYAVNVMARYVQSDDGDIEDAVRATGGAVGLCSATTIIGYGSLLFASNRALFSFGVVAILGEFACLASAVVLLPAALVLLRRTTKPRQVEAK